MKGLKNLQFEFELEDAAERIAQDEFLSIVASCFDEVPA